VETEGSDRVKDLIDIGSRAAAQSSAENFPVALRVIPARPRDELHRLYRFARFVDDVGDEAGGDRLALLRLVEDDVRALDSDDGPPPTLPAVADMQPVLRRHRAPAQPLLDLVAANRMDQTTTTYATFDDLLGYCRLSAAPVGRMVLYIADAATEENIADSDSVCAALQVLEHCQDVGEDARNGRVYLPQADLRACGVATDDLHASVSSRELRRAVELQVTRARRLLRAGRPLVHRLRGWAKIAVTGYVAGGQATAAAVQRHHYDVLGRQVRPSRWGTAARAATAAAWR
jgi:squalene synthase HpnC